MEHHPPPKILEFQLTLRCQYRCLYCGNAMVGSSDSEPSFDQLFNIIEKLNPEKVSFTGGEPTLRWNLLIDSIRYAHSKKITTQLNTNGSGLTFDKVKELESAGLTTLHISLSTLDSKRYQAIRRINDSFALIHLLDIVRYSCSHTNMKVILESLLMKFNLSEIDKIYTVAASCGVNEFEVQNIIPTEPAILELIPKDRDIIESINFLLKKKVNTTKIVLCCLQSINCFNFLSHDGVSLYDCQCGKKSIYITTSGDVFPCSFFHKNIGNAFSENIITIWDRYKLSEKNMRENPCET